MLFLKKLVIREWAKVGGENSLADAKTFFNFGWPYVFWCLQCEQYQTAGGQHKFQNVYVNQAKGPPPRVDKFRARFGRLEPNLDLLK